MARRKIVRLFSERQGVRQNQDLTLPPAFMRTGEKDFPALVVSCYWFCSAFSAKS
jgi:hypothetical protein